MFKFVFKFVFVLFTLFLDTLQQETLQHGNVATGNYCNARIIATLLLCNNPQQGDILRQENIVQRETKLKVAKPSLPRILQHRNYCNAGIIATK